MAPGVSSDDGSVRSRSLRCGTAGAAANGSQERRELRRPKQETLDQLNMTINSVKGEAAGKGGAAAAKVDQNANVRPEELSLPPSPLGSSAFSDTLDENQTFFPFDMSLRDFLQDPAKGSGIPFPYIETELVAQVKHINRPIGITLLVNGNVVVGDRGKDMVIMYDTECNKLKEIHPGRKFKRPSDMVTMPDGRFAVRDDNGLQLFDEEGGFLKTVVPKGILGMCFGLATDGKGNIYTINTNRRGEPDCMTKKGDTDILIISVESGQIVEQIQLVDIITDQRSSQCKFLHCDGVKLYISDLGLNVVYVMELGGPKAGVVRSFGMTGKKPGQFKDVAGIAADTDGNVLIVDACNNRIQVFNGKRQFMGMVKIQGREAALRRPSGIALDMENETIYVLNLWSNCLSKFKLVRP